MSGKVVGWAMEQITGSPAAKLVLVKLADNANEEGLCWPSVGLIVRHTELSERTVREHLRGLAENGLVEVQARVTAKGQASNVYQLNVPRQVNVRPLAATAPSPRSSRTPSLRQSHRRPAAAAGPIEEPSIEPSLNPVPIVPHALTARAERLCQAIGKTKFDAWFGDVEFIEGSPVLVVAPSLCKRNWIAEKYFAELTRAFGDDVVVDLVRAPQHI